jgi:integrase
LSKTKKINFTKKGLEQLPAEETRYSVFDANTRGLALAVYPTGQKTFFHLKKVQGWPQRVTIGSFPDLTVEQARGQAAGLNNQLATWKAGGYEGANPTARSREAAASSLGELLNHYCDHHLVDNAKNGERAVSSARWQFDTYLASWRNRPLSSIRRADVRERHAEIGKKHGQVTANRVVTFLRTLYNHALDPDVALWEGVNPCAKPKKFLFHEASRERVIADEEKPKFFQAIVDEQHRDLRDFLLLALSTGARRGTIFAMRWDEIDWNRELWVITNPKGWKQNLRAHVLPLTKLAVGVIRARTRVKDNPFVFPGLKRETHLTTLKKPWAIFLKRAGITNLRIHDLRRTLATVEGETGASTEIIQKTLGHEEASAATKIYDRSQRRDAVREAITVAEQALLSAGKTSRRKLLGVGRG